MRHCLILLVGLVVPALPAHGDLVLNAGQPEYEVGVGGTIVVDVFLTETGTKLLETYGLIGAGVLVEFNEQPFAVMPAQVVGVAPNPGVNSGTPDFDFLETSLTPASPGSVGLAELDWGLTTNTFFPAPGESTILIGSFRFIAGSVADDVTTLSFGLSGLKFVLGDGTDLDDTLGIAATSATITTITQHAVPEPASSTLLAIIVIPSLAWRLFTRKHRGSFANRNATSWRHGQWVVTAGERDDPCSGTGRMYNDYRLNWARVGVTAGRDGAAAARRRASRDRRNSERATVETRS